MCFSTSSRERYTGLKVLASKYEQLVGHMGRAGPRGIPIAKQSLGLCPSLCEFDELHIAVTADGKEMFQVRLRIPEEDTQRAERIIGAALRSV